MLDGALRIPLEARVQGSDSRSGCQNMLRVGLIHGRPQLLTLVFPGTADRTLGFSQERFDAVEPSGEEEMLTVPNPVIVQRDDQQLHPLPPLQPALPDVAPGESVA